MRTLETVLPLVLFGALSASGATAGTLAFTSSGSILDAGGANAPVNLGLVFTANSNSAVNALGFYFQNDLTGPETVGLYNSAGALLSSTIVPLSNAQVDGYVFQTITPVALSAGNQYTVVAFVGNNDWSYSSIAPNQAAGVTYDYHNYLYSSSLQFTTQTASAAGGPGGTYYGPNFTLQSTATPLPAGLPLFASGLSVLGFFARLKKRKAIAAPV
jgi:hypothetical protein